MKLSSHHLKEIKHEDVVTRRAQALGITPEEVFARAYSDAGKMRSSATSPFREYCRRDRERVIPQIVQDFCTKTLPTCQNPSCPNPKIVARFSRTDIGGRTEYFCSVGCMDATPQAVSASRQSVSSAIEGREILERVRIAMSNATFAKVPPQRIRPMEGQPRLYFNTERMERLKDSFKAVGQITPGIIRRVPLDDNGCDHELLDGERRWRAAQMSQLSEYRAMLVEIDDQAAPYVVSVIANFNREEHTVLELADAVLKMHEGLKLTMYEISRVLGLSHVNEASKLYGLRRLIPTVRDMLDPNLVKGHTLSKAAAVQISLRDPDDQLELAEKMMNRELTLTTLKDHVRRVDESRGKVIPERYMSPEHRRKGTESRIEKMARNAYDFERWLAATDLPEALQAFPLSHIRNLMGKLEQARSKLGVCHGLLEEVAQRKKIITKQIS